jgi:hypothetical protein
MCLCVSKIKSDTRDMETRTDTRKKKKGSKNVTKTIVGVMT